MQTHNFILGLNGYMITKYRSIAMANDVNVLTYTEIPNEYETKWHRNFPKTL